MQKETATAVSAGDNHTCAITSSGGVKCWGSNNGGLLGDGTFVILRSTPVDVVTLTNGVTAVSAGGSHNCALTTAGEVKCWGYNGEGQLGNGTTVSPLQPVSVTSLAGNIKMISSGSLHTCALTNSGGVKCWGLNLLGQLGTGTSTGPETCGGYVCSTKPVDISSLSADVIAISSGLHHTCAVTASGGVKCWGNNNFGELGIGTNTGPETCVFNRACSTVPVEVSGLQSGVTAIAAGIDHTCVITSAGGVKCWGNNSCGELGNGTASDSFTPVDVTGLTDRAIAITVGLQHTCVLTSSSAVKCWGAPLGLGNGSDNCSFSPVDVTGLASNVVAVSTKSSHTCALTSSGGIKCWGFNVNGELGNGDHTGPELCSSFPCSKTPVSVIGFGG